MFICIRLPETVRRIISTYIFQIDDLDTSNEDLICTLCNKLILDPYRASCGCFYCRDCISCKIFSGENYCNGGKEACKNGLLVLQDDVQRCPPLNETMTETESLHPEKLDDHITYSSELSDRTREWNEECVECTAVDVACTDGLSPGDLIESCLVDDSLPDSDISVEWMKHFRNQFDSNKSDIDYLKEYLTKSENRIMNLEDDSRITKDNIMTLGMELTEQRNRILMLEKDSEDLNVV